MNDSGMELNTGKMLLHYYAEKTPPTDYLNYSSLELTSQLRGRITALEKGSNPRIDIITLNISFIPLTSEYQVGEITSVKTTPKAKVTEGKGSLIMTWDTIGNEREFTYEIDTRAVTQNTIKKVTSMRKFPISDLEKDYVGFTEPTEFIDVNDDIRSKAVEIIGGETDLYKAMFKVADWVKNNVEYDLTTLTADAVQKSSWVLENKRGVCDEITNLFISMLRSVGIPARFIAGVVYTNIGNKFGNHGWAEVYFPGDGWVPVDVTYGQYGFVDPTHVKFKEVTDSGAASADYSWRSRDIELKFDELNVATQIQNEYPGLEKQAIISVEPLKYKVGPGSNVPVQVIAENPNDYYMPLKIIIKKAPKLLDNEVSKEVLLGPHESSSVFWTVVIPEDLDPKTVYTTTVEAYSPFAGSAETTIKFAENYDIVSKSWADDIIASLSKREDKSYFPNLDWKCGLAKEAYYQEETAALSCDAKNTGNTLLQNIKFCLDNDCKTRNLEVGAEEKVEWNLLLKEEKTRKLIVTAESDNLIRYSYPTLKIVLDPKLKITNLNQKPTPYNSEDKMSFTLTSEDYAKNIKLLISRVGQVAVNELEGSYDVIVNYPGRAFYDGKIRIRTEYEDELGKKYSNQQMFNATITDVPWYVQLSNWINSILKTDIQ